MSTAKRARKQVSLGAQAITIAVLVASARIGEMVHSGISGGIVAMLVLGLPIALAIRWATKNYPFDFR